LGFIRLIVLARLLNPEDFGLLGISLLILAIFDTFSQTGFGEALVQKKGQINEYLDVSWTVTIIRGLILFVLLFLCAPLAAKFFNVSEAKLIIRVIALSILFKAFINVGVVYFPKNLEFNKQFFFGISATLADFAVAISAALVLKNAWALVFGCIAGNLARLIVSYRIHPYRPHIRFDWVKAKELFSYGRWIWGSTILVFLVTQGDDLFVGRFLGIAALGFYQMAYRISNLAATEIAQVISQVTFPTYAILQDDLMTLRRTFLKASQITIFVAALLTGLIFMLAPEFTRIFMGEKWMAMVPAMQVLVFVGLFKSIAATAQPVFLALNRPDMDTKLRLFQLIILAGLIYPFSIRWGIFGTSLAVLVSIVMPVVGSSIMVVRIAACDQLRFWYNILFPFLSASAMVVTLSFMKVSFPGTGIWQFILFSVSGIAVYLVITGLLDHWLNFGMFELVKKSFLEEKLIKLR
jgi:O-antigen/teichoic acid export membrane protein